MTQTDISKMIRNYRKGPYVETFLRTLHGLNVKPSEFFAELERGSAKPPGAVALRAPLPAVTDDETQLALAIGRQFLRLLRHVDPFKVQLTPELLRKDRRRLHDPAPSSNTVFRILIKRPNLTLGTAPLLSNSYIELRDTRSTLAPSAGVIRSGKSSRRGTSSGATFFFITTPSG